MSARGKRPLGASLADVRRRSFVGRDGEVELFRAAMTATDVASLLLVTGPGGIGKSVLLEMFADLAASADAHVVRLTGRDLSATPDEVHAALGSGLAGARDDEPVRVVSGRRLVLLVDDYEHLAALDGWFRTRLLPRLPEDTVTVIAGRDPVATGWRSDPAWSAILRIITLRNLGPEATGAYLTRAGVAPEQHAAIRALTYGHPLALSLLRDLLARAPDTDLARLPEYLIQGLLERVVEQAPSGAHQRALGAAAIARVTTEDLLRDVLGAAGDARAAFEWLAGLSFVEPHTGGLMPHDLVRDLLDADLRWRDRSGYRRIFRAVHEHALARVTSSSGRDQQRSIADLKFCFRSLRGVLSPVAWDAWGGCYPDMATPHDHAPVLRIVAEHEGPEAAAIAAHWIERQPGGCYVIRTAASEVRGVIMLLDLSAAGEADRRADPGAEAAWRYVERTAPADGSEVVTQCRFIVDAAAYQAPSATINAVPILTLQHQLSTRDLAWDLVTLAEPDQWDEFFAAADMPRARGADFTVGGRLFGCFGHDFRAVPVQAMTRRWTERALSDEALGSADAPPADHLVLAHGDFVTAVRRGLRDLRRPDLLAKNQLIRSRLVRDAAHEHHGPEAQPDRPDEPAGRPDDPAGRLETLIRAAINTLDVDPRDDPLHAAVQVTYLSGCRTQEAAAARLGLPFSTYRRHLSRGTDRVVTWLWRRELGTGERD